MYSGLKVIVLSGSATPTQKHHYPQTAQTFPKVMLAKKHQHKKTRCVALPSPKKMLARKKRNSNPNSSWWLKINFCEHY